jgi:hypothetical protein
MVAQGNGEQATAGVQRTRQPLTKGLEPFQIVVDVAARADVEGRPGASADRTARITGRLSFEARGHRLGRRREVGVNVRPIRSAHPHQQLDALHRPTHLAGADRIQVERKRAATASYMLRGRFHEAPIEHPQARPGQALAALATLAARQAERGAQPLHRHLQQAPGRAVTAASSADIRRTRAGAVGRLGPVSGPYEVNDLLVRAVERRVLGVVLAHLEPHYSRRVVSCRQLQALAHAARAVEVHRRRLHPGCQRHERRAGNRQREPVRRQ